MINGDVLLGSMAVALMTAWIVPDVFDGRETVALIVLITMSLYNAVLYLRNRRERIRAKRAELSITAGRQETTRRQDRVVDIRMRRKSKAVSIPAYKVND